MGNSLGSVGVQGLKIGANTRSTANVPNQTTKGKHLFVFSLDTNRRSWLSTSTNKRSGIVRLNQMNEIAKNNKQSLRPLYGDVTGGVLVDPVGFFSRTPGADVTSAIRASLTKPDIGTRPSGLSLPQRVARPIFRPATLALVMMVLMTLAIALWSQVARANDRGPVVATPRAYRVVAVQSGDSLWSLARAVQPEGDIRPLVDQMVSERGGSVLRVGDEVSVPLP
jgi:hypothetical protein